jgi:hypothetical protein
MQSQPDIDDALIAQFLGRQYVGRRYLRYAELEALGLCDNRGSLKNWMDAGGFPRGIRIPGRTGKTLVWLAVEVARLIAQRVCERDGKTEVLHEVSPPEWTAGSVVLRSATPVQGEEGPDG